MPQLLPHIYGSENFFDVRDLERMFASSNAGIKCLKVCRLFTMMPAHPAPSSHTSPESATVKSLSSQALPPASFASPTFSSSPASAAAGTGQVGAVTFGCGRPPAASVEAPAAKLAHEMKGTQDAKDAKSGEKIGDGGRAIVFLDLETTGLSTSRSRIVEIGMVRLWPNGAREQWCSLVNPEMPIPEAARAVHGLGDADVRDQKTFRELAPQVESFIGGHDLGGHNLLRYDLPLLQSELERAGRPPLPMAGRRCVDTLVIFRKLEPHTLSKAVAFYCRPDVQRRQLASHRALGDATASLEIFCAQLLRYGNVLGPSVVDAANFCRSPTNPTASFALASSRTKTSSSDPVKTPAIDPAKQTATGSATIGLDANLAGSNRGFREEPVAKGIDGQWRLTFGKHRGQTLEIVARSDPSYLRWLAQKLPTNEPDHKLILDAIHKATSL